MSGNVITIILGGGRGTRLSPLTSDRSKPAVPFGAKYRLVDIPISNSINSGLHRIFVLTQFNSRSLHRHLHRAYPYEAFGQTNVELLSAEQTPDTVDWFQGTADAVRKHLSHYHAEDEDTVLILSGDHLYRMDYQEILNFHEENDCDITVANVPVPKSEVSEFGIMKIKADSSITDFLEKPGPGVSVDAYEIPKKIKKIFGVKDVKPRYLASMGVYVFKGKALREVLAGEEIDFGKEIIPNAIKTHKVLGYVYTGYWRDIGTIKAFFDASIDLTKDKPPFSFMVPDAPIYTRARFLPPNIVSDSSLKSVLLGEGCVVQGAKIEKSVIGIRSIIGEGTTLNKAVLLGNDFYGGARGGARKVVGIGKNCTIKNCIIDKNVRIENDVKIINKRKVDFEDGDNYCIRDGIVIIPKDARLKSGTVI